MYLLYPLGPWKEPCSAIFFFPYLPFLVFMATIIRCLQGCLCHTLWIALPIWLRKLWTGRPCPITHSCPTSEPVLMVSFLEASRGPVLSLRWDSWAASLGTLCLQARSVASSRAEMSAFPSICPYVLMMPCASEQRLTPVTCLTLSFHSYILLSTSGDTSVPWTWYLPQAVWWCSMLA